MSAAQSILGNEVRIPAGPVSLSADLVIPTNAIGLVLFAHGSGSGRHSPRNRYVAGELNDGRIATLLADLLTEREEVADQTSRRFRFDIALLTSRLVQIADWLESIAVTSQLPLGLFGASTGAAAALDTAATRPAIVRAVVSRGGRPDLATHLEAVHAPTLLIVGGNDHEVLRLNQQALRALTCSKSLDVVPGATHLFEEPGCLEHVASLARSWFTEFLT
jgi:putative phosphoribosyl transferase